MILIFWSKENGGITGKHVDLKNVNSWLIVNAVSEKLINLFRCERETYLFEPKKTHDLYVTILRFAFFSHWNQETQDFTIFHAVKRKPLPRLKLTIRMFMKSSFIATTQIDSRFQLVICKRCSVIQWNASFLLSSSPRCIYTNRLFERRSIEVPQIRNKITKCKPAVGFQLRFVVNRITFRLCELVPVTRQG